MTDEEKKVADAAKASEANKAALAERDKRIADLEGQLANVGRGSDAGAQDDGDVRARAVAEAEARDAHTPSPTQAELNSAKLGEQVEAGKSGAYKTRQTKAA